MLLHISIEDILSRLNSEGAESIVIIDERPLTVYNPQWGSIGINSAQYRQNNDPNAMPHVDDQFYLDYRFVEHANYRGRQIDDPDVFKLRLEVDTEGMSTDELELLHREYGVILFSDQIAQINPDCVIMQRVMKDGKII